MKIRQLYGDLTNSTANYIVHCVNCKGKMSGGLAKTIRTKWPIVYTSYRAYLDQMQILPWGTCKNSASILGKVLLVKINAEQEVANMFCQENYGVDNRQYVDYNAVRESFKSLANIICERFTTEEQVDITIAIPYKFGCGLAGGNWDVMYDIIVTTLNDLPIILEIWKLEQQK